MVLYKMLDYSKHLVQNGLYSRFEAMAEVAVEHEGKPNIALRL